MTNCIIIGCESQMFYFILLLCSIPCNILCQKTPIIQYISPKQVKDIGGTVELSCSVQYNQNYPVLWSKVDKNRLSDPIPISTDTTPIIRDSRFSLRYDFASSTYTLQIKDIQESDAGLYRCQILLNVNNKLTDEVELQVRRPPIIYDNSTRSVIVSEHQSVKLECFASGHPQPKISWRRENNAILPTGGSIYRGNTLKIGSIKKEDRGTYYCEADNDVGRSVRRNVAVNVQFPPVVVATKSRVGQALSYDIDLECRIEAYPSPIIIWIKDDIQLSNNQHYSLLYSTTTEEFTDSTVRVITVEEQQYGKYICRATNKLGQAEATVDLYEADDPVCPPACKGCSIGDHLSLCLNIFFCGILFYFIY